MLEAIKSLFATAPYIAWSCVLVLLAMVSIAFMWDTVKWWWMNTWMSFPVIGKIARYANDINTDPRDKSWFKSEKALCSEYKQYARVMDESDYKEMSAYTVFAGDNGRHPMPGWIWPVIIALVFVEAMGFSYVLAGFTIPGASENMQQVGAYGIAFLVSVVLIFVTHFSGHELYRNSQINDARMKWNADGRERKLESSTVSLDMPQSTDAGQPDYTRRINRIGFSTASFKMTTGTLILIVLIAIGATYVRGQVLEKMLQDEVAGKTEQIHSTTSAPVDGLDMGGDVKLPAADRAQDNAAQDKVTADGTSTERKGGEATFIVLAVIFVALQALGIYFGFHWGFAGQNSKDAYKAIGRGKFATYRELESHQDHVIDTAQSKLEDLQQRLMEENSKNGTKGVYAGKNTFRDYMSEQRKIKASYRVEGNTSALASVVNMQPITTSPVLEPVQAAEDQALELASAMQQILALNSKEDKKAYINTLPLSLQTEVMVALKTAKDNEKAKVAKMDAELEDLL